MTKMILPAMVMLITVSLCAQNYDAIKTTAILQQFARAKIQLDTNMNKPGFTSKPEAFILKTLIYASLAMDGRNKMTPEVRKLADDADAAFSKYKAMDPSMVLINDPLYQNGVINLYSFYYFTAFAEYEAKKWEPGLICIRKAVDYSDLLISKKAISVQIDTNVLILAGICAENTNQKSEAVKYYSRIADAKCAGAGFESVYRFLVTYYFQKNDMAGFEKYKSYGQELYPSSQFFNYDHVDFAVGFAADNFTAKMKVLDDVLAKDPNNYKAWELIGELIYDSLHPGTNKAIPANTAELEKKMINAFNKAAAAKPGYEYPYLYIGDHYTSQANQIMEETELLAKIMRQKINSSTDGKSSPEDLSKRNMLSDKYGKELEKARVPYEKAAAIYAQKPNLTPTDKKQYKKVLGYIADTYAFKKRAATNVSDRDKYAAEEKKWNDVYDSVK